MKIRLNIKSFQQAAIITDSAKLTRILETVRVGFFSLWCHQMSYTAEKKNGIVYIILHANSW